MITNESANQLRAKLNLALASVAKDFGCIFEVGNITYNSDEMHTKVTFRIGNTNMQNDPLAKFKLALKKVGYKFGVTESDFNLVDSKTGNKFVGISERGRKYPYVFQQPNGKLVLYPYSMFEKVRYTANLQKGL
jgi:hypothetical protein